MNMQGKLVEVIRDVPGLTGISCGLPGRVEWDEGGDDVIVEFEREVPNGGFLSNRKQAWVPRHFLKLTEVC